LDNGWKCQYDTLSYKKVADEEGGGRTIKRGSLAPKAARKISNGPGERQNS
jgi:hypothetical protein